MNEPKLRILVVEDDIRMLDLLCQGLREAGHTVMPAPDGIAGLDLAMEFAFDVIVLDIGLPHRNGYEITRVLRSQNKSVPILILTARDAEDDVIRGFDLGADDYLIKPFSFPELVARLHVLARRAQNSRPGNLLVLDAARLTARRENRTVQLTRTEFLLLAALVDHADATVTRRSLIEAVWGTEDAIHPNTLDVFINALRSKIDAPFASRLIVTVRGTGYRISTPAEYQELAG